MQKTGAACARRTVLTFLATAGVFLTAGLATAVHATGKSFTMGFAQVGAEGEWRTADSESIKSTAKAQGVNLRFSDAQQKQENQIKAVHSYIVQKVDVITSSPVMESDRDTVLQEARVARIPVILTDRGTDSKDTWLYTTFIGSDFVEEGRKASRWLLGSVKPKGDVNTVESQDTVDSAPAIDRKRGFGEIIKADPHYEIIRSQTSDFIRAKGREVMEVFLKAEGKKINVLYAHNDDMTIGAIQVIEEAGFKPGKDIVTISIDDVKGAFEAMMADKLSVTVECSPLLKPQPTDTARVVLTGKTVPKRIVTKEGIFPMEVAAKEFPDRKY